jgi:hypothetical protein
MPGAPLGTPVVTAPAAWQTIADIRMSEENIETSDWKKVLESLDHYHAWRFRELCSDDNPDVEQRDGYRDEVLRMGGVKPPIRPFRQQVATASPCGCCGGLPPGIYD